MAYIVTHKSHTRPAPQRTSTCLRLAAPPMAAGVSATAIALGSYHTCAIEAGGEVKCWGSNGIGQLGIGITSDQTSPVAVPGPGGVAGYRKG